jgi:predicted ATPase
MKALNLRDAINILDPEHPLKTEKELRDYFVNRAMSPLDDLSLLLQDTTSPQKVLFTGHRGSGKSTELAKLQQGLREQFFIVHYSIKNILNLYDLKYVDVVLSLGLELIREATGQRVKVKQKVLNHVLSFTKEITKETVSGIKGQAEAGAELNLYVMKLSSKLNAEDATRTTVREIVSHRLSDLLESIDLLSREVEKIAKRRVLVIIEDLDKTDLNTAKQLFYGHATSLLAPPISIIYSFPTALRHDNDFMQIEMNFPNVYILPNLKTRKRDGQSDEEGLGQLRNLLTKRADRSLFTSGALTDLAELSSGIPRELIALARRACIEARKADQTCINEECVKRAARSKRMDYQVLLTSQHLDLLKQVEQKKRVENDEAHRALLHNLSVLEYRNDVGVWYDVHPLIKPLLTKGA